MTQRVLAFGTFDLLHRGHKNFLQRAKALGDTLTVVVARDSVVTAHKHQLPYQDEQTRLRGVRRLPIVDNVLLGSATPHDYTLLATLDFDVLAVGYDQLPADDTIRHELDQRGKGHVRIVRLKPFHPEKYKTSLLRPPPVNG